MSYSPNGSGAYTTDAVASLNEYFKYSSSYYFDYRDNYSDAVWIEMLKNNLDYGMPFIYSGYGNVGGHAFCCDGYDDSDMFHFNWGWSGAYNAYFEVSNLNPGTYTFSDGCGAGFGVMPAPEELAMPQNVVLEQPTYNQINISWEAPATKEMIGYRIYRNGLIIEELDAGATTFSETLEEEAEYYYGVKAVYDNPIGESDCEIFEVFIELTCNITFSVKDANNEMPIRQALITFMGETAYTNLAGSATISNIPWDTEEYDYTVEADGYETHSGQTNIQGSHQVDVELNPIVNIADLNSLISIYPNPTVNQIIISNNSSQQIEISITNINGKIIFNETTNSNKYSIDLQGNNPGIYFISIRTETEIINKKIIKL